MNAEASSWQEAWNILAQAWRAPVTAAQCKALRQCLASDLSSLAQELALTLDCQTLAERLAALDDQTMLVVYSRLFLAPPCAAQLDLGNGVDGQQMGPYAQTMAQRLAELDLRIPDDCHEHPDYLPVVLEVAARLEVNAADSALRLTHLKQMLQGLQLLQQSLTRHAADSAWCSLATLTDVFVRHRLALLGASEAEEASPSMAAQRREQRQALTARLQHRHRDAPVTQAVASHAERSGVAPEALLEMIATLEAQGLDASHLRGRLPDVGWTSLVPPEARRGRTSKAKAAPQVNPSASAKE